VSYGEVLGDKKTYLVPSAPRKGGPAKNIQTNSVKLSVAEGTGLCFGRVNWYG